MAKKKIRAPFYTKKRLGIQSLFNDTRLPNGWLYAEGKHSTRITAKDLPDTFIPLTVYIEDTVLVQAVDLQVYDAFLHGKVGAAV